MRGHNIRFCQGIRNINLNYSQNPLSSVALHPTVTVSSYRFPVFAPLKLWSRNTSSMTRQFRVTIVGNDNFTLLWHVVNQFNFSWKKSKDHMYFNYKMSRQANSMAGLLTFYSPINSASVISGQWPDD